MNRLSVLTTLVLTWNAMCASAQSQITVGGVTYNVLADNTVEVAKVSTDTLYKTDLIWNQGLRYRNYHHILDTDADGWEPAICEINDLSELIPGKPGGVYDNYLNSCQSGGSSQTIDGSAPSVTLISLNYDADEYIWNYDPVGSDYGFGMYPRREKFGDPIEFQFVNMAGKYSNSTEKNKLREIGLMFMNWGRNTNQWAFRDLFRIGDFDDILLKFKAKVDRFNTDDGKNGMYVTCDFRYIFWDDNEPDDSKANKRGDLIGVLVFERNPPRTLWGLGPESTSPIWWESDAPIGGNPSSRKMFRGKYFNIAQLTDEYVEVTINYMDFIKQMPDPPAGMTWRDARIQGLDIYSSVRGCDLNFTIKDVQFIGIKRSSAQ